ncbi:hypothetical protein J4Q44_G00202040 [Coregonus suidteri]|uniref:KN motif and ankyrin repeat domain-containing protein 4 n=1 Tax=Coregonus suidteri TaxID=861788 RepID=A0AAN8LRE9_9TELE
MDKKSANGYPRAGAESGDGSQRKQLPYSVETPYGFHLDLDFLKYVDDIEKGNTIKRVHIQRKARCPPKFSTLPRNFSLLGHGAWPAPKDTWSSTSTLGPKPRGRVTEVQQILDFRHSDGGSGTSGGHSQNSRVQGGSLASARPSEEAGAGARVLGEQLLWRPNLLRTSSMPVTIPHRKDSESGDERTENGSSENVVCAVPQDRLGLHQQITAALKRVRELEDMVRTIPELKSQICSLRVEREQLILRLQDQTKPQPPHPPQSASPSPAPSTDPGPASQLPGAGAAVDPGRAESTASETEMQQESLKSTAQEGEPDRLLAAQEPERQAQTSEGPDRQTFVNPLAHTAERQTEQSENVTILKAPEPLDSRVFVQVIEGVSVSGEGDLHSIKQLQAKLVALEAKLSQASEDLDRTNSLLRQQVEENRMKEERILQLSEGGIGGAEEVSGERQTSRRTSVDQQTETERVGSVSQETETERADMVEQGTDTERIVICLTRKTADIVDQGTETEQFDTQDQVTETEMVVVCPVRPRANSVDQGTETERVDTVDQVTETPPGDSLDQVTQTVVSVDQTTETAPERAVRPARHRANSVDQGTETQTVDTVNKVTVTETQTGVSVEQVTETQTQTAPVRPVRPARHRAKSVDRRTETERVGTVDQVTETVVAQSAYQQTETERDRVETSNNPHTEIEIESAAIVSAAIESAVTEIEEAERVVSCSVVKDGDITESAVSFVVVESVGTENVATENVVTENVVTESMVTKRQVVVVEETVVEQITVTESVVTQSTTTESTVIESAVTENLETESEVVKTTVTESMVTESAVIESPAPESTAVAPTPSSSQTQMGQKESEQAQPQSQNPSCGSNPVKAQAQAPRQGSNPALGQVVTRLTGLINEQWAQLGGSQDKPDKQETPSPSAQKPAEGQGMPATGKPSAGKAAGKSGLSKMSSIQSQLVSSLSALSAFYSPGQKAAASKQQGLKSIMKKNDADKQGNRGGAKKNLKFVGVNGGYETTSSEDESSEEEKEEAGEEEVDSSENEEQQEEQEKEEGAGAAQAQEAGAQAGETEGQEDPQDPENSQALLEEQPAAAGETIDKGFMEACHYIKDRMAEVVTPDKEMRHVLMVLYQEWFRVSSQKDSLADTVTLYLREVGITTPTLLRYIVNLADGNGNTALHYSVSHSNFPVVKLLLDTGLCEVDIQNKAGYTAVMLASLTAADRSEDMEVALQLLRQGDVNARARQAGQTALMLSVSHGRTAMVRLLLSCQADLNIQDKDGSTALMCACEHGHTEIARVLLESGHCDTSLTDKDGQSALSVVVAASNAELVDLLKSHSDSTTTQASNPSTTSLPPQ